MNARNFYFLYTSQHALPPRPGKMEHGGAQGRNTGGTAALKLLRVMIVFLAIIKVCDLQK